MYYICICNFLGSNPICEMHPYEDGVTGKSSDVELKCSLQFWGEWPPIFRWHIVNGSELNASSSESTDNVVMSSVIVPSNSTHNDEIVVQCTTYFTEHRTGQHVSMSARPRTTLEDCWTLSSHGRIPWSRTSWSIHRSSPITASSLAFFPSWLPPVPSSTPGGSEAGDVSTV